MVGIYIKDESNYNDEKHKKLEYSGEKIRWKT